MANRTTVATGLQNLAADFVPDNRGTTHTNRYSANIHKSLGTKLSHLGHTVYHSGLQNSITTAPTTGRNIYVFPAVTANVTSAITLPANSQIVVGGTLNVNANIGCSNRSEIRTVDGGTIKFNNGLTQNCKDACLMAESTGVLQFESPLTSISNEAFIAAKGGVYEIAPNAKLLIEATAGMPMLDPNSIFKVAQGAEFINHKSTDFPTGNVVELNGGKYIVAAGTSTFKAGSKLKLNGGTLEISAGAKVVLEADNAIEMLASGTITIQPGGSLELKGLTQIPNGKILTLNGGGNVLMGNSKLIEVFGGLVVQNLTMTATQQWNGLWFRQGSIGGVNSSTLTKLGAGAYSGALWIESSSPEFINNTLETVNCVPHCYVFSIGGASANPLIRNNIITSNGGDGVYVRDGARSILYDNSITVNKATASAYLQTSTSWNSWYWGSGYGGKNKLMGGQHGIYLVQGVLDASGYGAQNHLCGHSGMDVVASYPSMVLGSNNRWENGVPKISGNVSAYPTAGTTYACSAAAKTDETEKTEDLISDLQAIIATWQEGKQALAAANLRSLIVSNPERSDMSAALWALAEFHGTLAEEANLDLLNDLAQRSGLLQRDARHALALAYKNVKEYDKALLALRGNSGFSANVLRFELYKETGNFELARKMLSNRMNPQDITQTQLLELFSHELEVYEEEAIKRGLSPISVSVLADIELPEVLAVSTYPNPLREEGKIRYELPEGSKVSLKIFDALGRLVAIVKDEFVEAGVYEAKWQVNGMPNGIYFYRFEAMDKALTGKMVVMK